MKMAINKVQKIRARNNILWMDILRLAEKHAPIETAGLLERITSNDQEISSVLYHAAARAKKKGARRRL